MLHFMICLESASQGLELAGRGLAMPILVEWLTPAFMLSRCMRCQTASRALEFRPFCGRYLAVVPRNDRRHGRHVKLQPEAFTHIPYGEVTVAQDDAGTKTRRCGLEGHTTFLRTLNRLLLSFTINNRLLEPPTPVKSSQQTQLNPIPTTTCLVKSHHHQAASSPFAFRSHSLVSESTSIHVASLLLVLVERLIFHSNDIKNIANNSNKALQLTPLRSSASQTVPQSCEWHSTPATTSHPRRAAMSPRTT